MQKQTPQNAGVLTKQLLKPEDAEDADKANRRRSVEKAVCMLLSLNQSVVDQLADAGMQNMLNAADVILECINCFNANAADAGYTAPSEQMQLVVTNALGKFATRLSNLV